MIEVDRNERQVRESIEHIADSAASKAVRETMLLIGIDLKDPIKAQAEFALLREIASPQTMSDLKFLRRLHGATDSAADTGWRAIIKFLALAGLGIIALVTKEYWFAHIWKG